MLVPVEFSLEFSSDCRIVKEILFFVENDMMEVKTRETKMQRDDICHTKAALVTTNYIANEARTLRSSESIDRDRMYTIRATGPATATDRHAKS